MTIKIRNSKKILLAGCMLFAVSCSVPSYMRKTATQPVPGKFYNSQDTVNSGAVRWSDFFKDPYLNALIDTAIKNNQELNVMLQEINIAQNEVRARKGQYLPFMDVGAGAGVDKVGRYTSRGANDANTDIMPGRPFPEPLPAYALGADVSWEADIWKRLRNSRKSAVFTYLSSVEGKNFMVTNLVAEIANTYYELMALDNQLSILEQNIRIQQDALEIVNLEKTAAKVTELAVKKFEAEVLKNQSRQFFIRQRITEAENHINFLVGRFPQHVNRNSRTFTDLTPDTIRAGLPSQLLANRPDIRRAEKQLAAARLDVKVARAGFYPSLRITAGVGFEAFDPKFLIKSPESLMYSLAGQLVAPLINRNAIKAEYYSANSRQVQAMYNYQRAVLNAFIEVANQVSNIDNLTRSFDLKSKQVDALTQSIRISTGLFKSARADYMEVLMTQRDALDSRFELVETRRLQMNAMVNIYQALGGGWR